MTYVDTSQRDEYTATSSQTVFAYTFRILANTHIKVYQEGSLLTITTHYTVSGVGDAGGGNVTLVTGATLDDTIILIRDTPDDQNTDYTASGIFPAESHETALDKLTMRGQDLNEKLIRSLKFAITSLLNDIAAPEGTSASDRGGKVWAWNSAGTALELLAATTVDAVSVIAVKGDIVQGDASGDAEKLAIGSTGGMLQVASGKLEYLAVGATSAVYQVVAGKIASVTNPILLIPTIADFTSATHDHSDAAGGGLVAGPEYRSGLNCKQASSTTITVEGGSINVDGTIVTKTSDTTLTLTTATDWVDDTSDQTTSDYGYVYINAAGKIEMDNVAPDESDTSGNTSGILRYCDTGTDTTDRRCIGWFYMNATGSGELNAYEVGNLKDGNVANAVVHTDGTNDVVNDTSYGSDITAMAVHFYSSGRGTVTIHGLIKYSAISSDGIKVRAEVHDGSDIVTSEHEVQSSGGSGPATNMPTHSESYAQGEFTFNFKVLVSSGTATVADKMIIITEN